MEGLFRNGNNTNLSGNVVSANIAVEKLDSSNNPSQQIYAKFLFSLENETRPAALQITYNHPKMHNSSIIKTTYLSNLHRTIKNDALLDRAVIFSLLEVFLLNRSDAIALLFRGIVPNFATNREIINPEKLRFYREYRRHLKNARGRLSNLRGSSREERMRLQEYRAMSLYRRSSAVKLVREDGRFFWKMELENLVARFSNENHHLRDLVLSTPVGNISVTVESFALFDGTYELPKRILVETRSGEKIKLTILRVKNYNGRKGYLRKKLKKYRKLEQGQGKKLAIASKDFYVY